jgi:hypothetical protein
MASFVVEVLCGEEMHRVELRDDGTARMLDHDLDEEMVAAFTAFGAKPPECLLVQRRWGHSPMATILDIFNLDEFTVARLAIDLFKHRAAEALPKAKKKECVMLDAFIASMLEALSYGADDETHSLANRLRWAFRDMPGLYGSESLFSAVGRLEYIVSEVSPRPYSGPFTLATRPLPISSPVNAIVDLRSDLLHAPGDRNKAEERWQRRHIFRVLRSLEERKPWPRLA